MVLVVAEFPKMSLSLAARICVRHMSTSVREKRRRAMLEKIIRVDHAGEFGAHRIYEGQMAVLGKTPVGPTLKEMHEQELEHKAAFDKLMSDNRVRPTVLLPLWNLAGFALGAGTALIGKEAAMACTVAVETAIGDHYNSQIRELMEDDPELHKELLKKLKKFRDEELEHLDTGLQHDAEKAPFYSVLSQVIKTGCTGAIWLSERI
ncbi:NADPH-dependent 3-demethoxyubiquinone 3-hydroxylase, mitochondrial-like isoform X2 [Babylonia areolata]